MGRILAAIGTLLLLSIPGTAQGLDIPANQDFEVYGDSGLGVGVGDDWMYSGGAGDLGGPCEAFDTNNGRRFVLQFPIDDFDPTTAYRARLELTIEQSRRDQYPAPGPVDIIPPFLNPGLGDLQVVAIEPFIGPHKTLYEALAAPFVLSPLVTAHEEPGAQVGTDVLHVVLHAWETGAQHVAFRVQTAQETDGDCLNDVWFMGASEHPSADLRPVLWVGEVVHARVDLRPGTAENALSTRGGGVVSAAIFGSAELDATTVDPATARLSGANVRATGAEDWQCVERDVDGDRWTDLVCHFEVAQLQLASEEEVVLLEALTTDGTRVLGSDVYRQVP
jgi:hypothetical protein